jgi:hypothetical protein
MFPFAVLALRIGDRNVAEDRLKPADDMKPEVRRSGRRGEPRRQGVEVAARRQRAERAAEAEPNGILNPEPKRPALAGE